MNIAEQLVKDFDVQLFQISNTLALFDEGATVPFIARYRKERTGSLDEIQIRDLQHKYDYYKELDERRAAILESIESQGKLTPQLKSRINETLSKTELEDLYLPYKPKRVTRGKKALEAGLEPLARRLVDCEEISIDLVNEATGYVNAEKGFETPEKAVSGACDILAEELSDNADIRKSLREQAWEKGEMVTSARKDFVDKKTKFSMYYDYRELAKNMPSHRILAMFRGEREKVLKVGLEFPRDAALGTLESKLVKHPGSATADLLRKTCEDALDRLLAPATETEIRKQIRAAAEEEAFKVFNDNLGTLLLSPPAGRKCVLGVDPGFRTGCKVVALDDTGRFLEYQTIYPNEPQKRTEQAAETIRKMIDTHGIKLIAIGNGTAGRETDIFMKSVIADYPAEKRPTSVIVNESGASVYSASDIAVKEFPDQDITVRGAVSIARRLQDPLSELVKIDPKAIGVGQYQHDVNQSKLKSSLEEVVESCVNRVGVDLNLASEELLKYVSGLNRTTASKIVSHRNSKGAISTRVDLLKVSGLGEKTFEQAAGFLRVPGSDNPLDNSAVHPERYGLVENMAKTLGTNVDNLIGNTKQIRSIDKNQFVTEDVGLPTIEDILAELEKPGRDPRAEFKYAKFSDTVSEIAHLAPGMKLEGTVTNVTNFGAFVDIGVHQDGLVHISQLADRYVDDPQKVVKVGQVVNITVLDVDKELKRISLSMKKEPEAVGAPKKPASGKGEKGQGRNKNPRQPQKPSSAADLKKWADNRSGRDSKGNLKTHKPKFSVKQIMK